MQMGKSNIQDDAPKKIPRSSNSHAHSQSAVVASPCRRTPYFYFRGLATRLDCGVSYQVFARKYRPQTFNDLVGQGHVTRTLKNAVTWIGDAGGIAIVAHPARYKFSPTEEYALFTEFKGHGGRGVEVVTGSHTAAEAERYAVTAKEFDLLVSRGSDFHSPDESRIDLGGLPPSPPGLTPVWSVLEARIH